MVKKLFKVSIYFLLTEPLFCVAQPEMFVSEKSIDTLKSFLTINHYLYITFNIYSTPFLYK